MVFQSLARGMSISSRTWGGGFPGDSEGDSETAGGGWRSPESKGIQESNNVKKFYSWITDLVYIYWTTKNALLGKLILQDEVAEETLWMSGTVTVVGTVTK